MTYQPENPPNLSLFLDFYVIEMAMHEINGNKVKVSTKVIERLEEAKFNIEYTLPLFTSAYLFSACLGEARHAPGMANKKIKQISELDDPHDREHVFENAYKFSLSPENVATIAECFNSGWRSSSYGGKAWGEVAEGLALYFSLPNGAFLDHIADLEHNGGCVFSKTENPYLQFNISGGSFKSMLDIKRDASDIKDMLDGLERYCIINLISKSLKMPVDAILQAKGLSEDEAYNYTHQFNATYIPNADHIDPPTFRDGKLSLINAVDHCDQCGNPIANGNAQHYNTQKLCRQCYLTHFHECDSCNNIFDKAHYPGLNAVKTQAGIYHLCDHCLRYRTHTCYVCSETIFQSGTITIDGKPRSICATCQENFTFLCRTCKELKLATEINPLSFQCYDCHKNPNNAVIECDHCHVESPKTYKYYALDANQNSTLIMVCHTCHYGYKNHVSYNLSVPMDETSPFYKDIEELKTTKAEQLKNVTINLLKLYDSMILQQADANPKTITPSTNSLYHAAYRNMQKGEPN